MNESNMNQEYQLYAVCDECGCEALFSPDETHPLCPSCRTPIPVNRLKKYTGAAGGSPDRIPKKDTEFIMEGNGLNRCSGGDEVSAKPKKKPIPIYVYALAALLLLAAGLLIFNPFKPAPATNSASSANELVQAEYPSNAKSEGVMTYAEYAAAPINIEVTIEAYVQARQSWWDNKASFFTQDADGAYFLYEMEISEEDFNRLSEGQKIKASGYKDEWAGQAEIIDATFEIEEGNWIADPLDVTDLLGTDQLEEYMGQKVLFKGVTVEAAEYTENGIDFETFRDTSGNESAFMYRFNGTGSQGDDVYFTVSKDGRNYTFLVRNYLTDRNTDVYKAAETLEIGRTYDMEGYLYWYDGPNPWITDIRKH